MKKTLIVLAVALALSACGRKSSDVAPQQTYTQAPAGQPVAAAGQPAIVNQAPAAQSDTGGMFSSALMGGLAGYMLGRSNTPAAAPSAPVVERRTVVNKYYNSPAPTAKAAPAPARPAAAPSAPKPSYAAARAPAPAPSRPSYSSARSSSSKR